MLYTWYSSGTSVSGGGGGGNSTARGPERACTASDECCGVAAECAINLGAGMLNIRSGSVSASEDTSTRPAGSGSVLSEPSGRTYKCVVDLLPCGGAAGAGLGGCEGTRAPEDAGRRSRSCKPRPTPDCGTTYHGTPCSCPLCRELMRRVNLFLCRRFSSWQQRTLNSNRLGPGYRTTAQPSYGQTGGWEESRGRYCTIRNARAVSLQAAKPRGSPCLYARSARKSLTRFGDLIVSLAPSVHGGGSVASAGCR